MGGQQQQTTCQGQALHPHRMLGFLPGGIGVDIQIGRIQAKHDGQWSLDDSFPRAIDTRVYFCGREAVCREVLAEFFPHLLSQAHSGAFFGKHSKSPGLAIVRRRRPDGCFQ
jgi:hypothetical protein